MKDEDLNEVKNELETMRMEVIRVKKEKEKVENEIKRMKKEKEMMEEEMEKMVEEREEKEDEFERIKEEKDELEELENDSRLRYHLHSVPNLEQNVSNFKMFWVFVCYETKLGFSSQTKLGSRKLSDIRVIKVI